AEYRSAGFGGENIILARPAGGALRRARRRPLIDIFRLSVLADRLRRSARTSPARIARVAEMERIPVENNRMAGPIETDCYYCYDVCTRAAGKTVSTALTRQGLGILNASAAKARRADAPRSIDGR